MTGGFLPENVRLYLRRRAAELSGLLLLALAGLGAALLLSYAPADPSLNAAGSAEAANLLGHAGAIVADVLVQTIGLVSAVPVLLFAVWGWRLLAHRPLERIALRIALLPFALIAGCLALSVLPVPESWPLRAGLGGAVGTLVLTKISALGVLAAFDAVWIGAVAGLPALGLLLWTFGASWREWLALARGAGRGVGTAAALGAKGGALGGRALGSGLEATASLARKGFDSVGRKEPSLSGKKSEEAPRLNPAPRKAPEVESSAPVLKATPDEAPAPRKEKAPAKKPAKVAQASLDLPNAGDYELPAMDLLAEAQEGAAGPAPEALQENARMLESVLGDFGVKGEIGKIRHGPVVTLYELEPAPGTKSSRVIGLSDDIARSMSAVSVRVAVVPGRNVIGIELPNARRDTVYLREILESDIYERSGAKLGIALGKDIGGTPVVTDLARMPHLLIAGTTGSGKSVAVNTMILSLLYRHSPERCRMIMIDPKMLELSIYDGIPHLLSPVVTDPKKAVVALKWTVREMESRYRAMSKLGVRNIDGYNARLAEARKKGEVLKRRVQTGFDSETGKPVFEEEPLDLTPLPYIVVVIDEVADLMLVAGKDIEGAVQRLAQMARAAGIHVIMATQRPSVDVITGTIKANFPTRISFQVTSKIDSRTILGEQGAEQLLGQGDMLYMAGGGRITRVHGPFVSDEEVEDVVRHLRAQGEPEYDDSVTEDDGEGGGDGGFGDLSGLAGGNTDSGDALYDQAVAIVARERRASTSFIQRHLKIGYNRAATLIERMESEGVVSSANHVGKREVLVRNPNEDE
ncbi:DNA translocase FtsK 4TM domain-containing protein [Nisaea acidiphila]|uniref:DNA translocase FtsK n=2 Tax=Nisaea acidiphila TaxID=1862145 RepID=A0A9J7AXV7_9PROT|nr:DNA translocase FtsK [Nisaea acidiphila]UUX52231.1 DNA translocase FtsK 4TM domain-containing protein [Nisaea acidiphila]